MGKTIVPVKGKDYKIVTGRLIGDSNSIVATLSFDSKIIGVFYTSINLTNLTGYYINENHPFWKTVNNWGEILEKIYGYGYNNTYIRIDKIDDYNIDMTSSKYNVQVDYVAILEEHLEDETHSIFLLNGTILYTDGTPTTDVADAIQTVDTNKYKIKSNALINIDNATYINLSN